MCCLNIIVAVFATLSERDDVIDMKAVAINGLPANAADAFIAFEDDLWIYGLYK